MKMNEMGGEKSTYATLRFWDDEWFGYREIVDYVPQRDARADYDTIHNPPLVIVTSVRYC